MDIELSLQKSHFASKIANESRAIGAIKNNSKYFFSYAKKHSTLPSKIGPLLDENNLYTGSSQTMSDILSRQYEKVFSVPSSSCPNTKPRSGSILGEIVFSMEDLIAAIDELSNNAGSGPDGLPAILLKKTAKNNSVYHSFCFGGIVLMLESPLMSLRQHT